MGGDAGRMGVRRRLVAAGLVLVGVIGFQGAVIDGSMCVPAEFARSGGLPCTVDPDGRP